MVPGVLIAPPRFIASLHVRSGLRKPHVQIALAALAAGAKVRSIGMPPAGLAVIRRPKREVLMRYVWMALLAGVGCDLIAFGTFISGALSAP